MTEAKERLKMELKILMMKQYWKKSESILWAFRRSRIWSGQGYRQGRKRKLSLDKRNSDSKWYIQKR